MKNDHEQMCYAYSTSNIIATMVSQVNEHRRTCSNDHATNIFITAIAALVSLYNATVLQCCLPFYTRHGWIWNFYYYYLGPHHKKPSTYTNVATYPLGKYKQCHSQHSEQCVCTGGNDTYAYVHRQGSLTGIRKPQY